MKFSRQDCTQCTSSLTDININSRNLSSSSFNSRGTDADITNSKAASTACGLQGQLFNGVTSFINQASQLSERNFQILFNNFQPGRLTAGLMEVAHLKWVGKAQLGVPISAAKLVVLSLTTSDPAFALWRAFFSHHLPTKMIRLVCLLNYLRN